MVRKTKKVAAAIKMINNPLTRRRLRKKPKARPSRNSTTRSTSRSPTRKAVRNVIMRSNPLRDCGSIGGAKKKTRRKARKRKSCGCSKSWF